MAELPVPKYQQSLAAVAWGPNHLHAFGINPINKYLYWAEWTDPSDITRTDWRLLQGNIMSPPVVIAPKSGNLHVVVRGKYSAAWVKYYDGKTWFPNDVDAYHLGGSFSSAFAVASSNPNSVDIVGKGEDNGFWYTSFRDGDVPPGWKALGGFFASQPSVVSWGPDRLDVFGKGSDGVYWWKYRNGITWSSDWVSLGDGFASPPIAVTKQAGSITLFGIDQKGNLLHQWFDGKTWGKYWENLGGNLSTTISVQASTTAAGAKRYDIFAGDNEHVLNHKVWDGSRWQPWEKLNKRTFSAPVVASWRPNHLDVFAVESSGQMIHQAWDGQTWTPSQGQSLGGYFINFDDFEPSTFEAQNPEAHSWDL